MPYRIARLDPDPDPDPARIETRLGRFLTGLVLALAIGSAAPAGAVVTTLLSSEANVSGSLSDDDESWSDSDQSLDLAPSISVSQSFSTNTSSNTFAFSAHAAAFGRLQMSTRSTAGSGGELSDSAGAHDFTIRFSVDGPAAYELRNGNASGTFPEASSNGPGASSSLVYELRQEGSATPVFVYVAPTDNAAGTYRSGVIPAGTYVWTGVGSATANGSPGAGSQSAFAIGNVRLQLEDAPPPPVPATGSRAILLLVFVLVTLGVVAVGSARRDDRTSAG